MKEKTINEKRNVRNYWSTREGWLLSGFWNFSQGFGVLPGF